VRELVTLWQAKQLAEEELLIKQGLIGVSVAPNGRIRLYLESEQVDVPQTFQGYRVEKIVTDKIKALSLPQASIGYIRGQEISKQDRARPCPGGMSIGHYSITAGTFACIVFDSKTGEPLILSNNHVLAASNKGVEGDAILQPGAYDGGKDPDDKIATLLRFMELNPYPGATNLVDAAVARPVSPDLVSPEVLDIGAVTGMEQAVEGMKVQKSGRTTCATTAIVNDVNATVKVSYPFGDAVFEDQVMTGLLGQPGDSGSCVVNAETRKAVGLLFAGSSSITVLNKMSNVCNLLGVRFGVAPAEMAPWPAILALQLPFAFGTFLLMYGQEGGI